MGRNEPIISPDDRALFREHVTSGAFTLSLSRSQVSMLTMIAEVGDVHGAHTHRALHNKGLVTTITSEDGRIEYRLTEAGVYALKLAKLADLVNGAPDPVTEELSSLRHQLDAARRGALQLAQDCWNLKARLDRAEYGIEALAAELHGGAAPPKPFIWLRDKNPTRSTAEILKSLDDVSRALKCGA